MSDMTVITNNIPRELHMLCDLPKETQSEFDYITGDDMFSYRMFRYKGAWHDAHGYTRVDALHSMPEFAAWQGYAGDSYFSGTLIRWYGEDDMIIVGRYYC